jgi:hypothetical protein
MTERLETISPEGLLAAAREILAARDAALAELKTFRETHARRSAGERERGAYLDGLLHGLGAAYREFEKRRPIEWTGS